MKLLDPDSPIMSFLARVADLVILNVLWLLCCLPVVTAGASTTAMYHVVRHLQEESISSVTRDFSARSNPISGRQRRSISCF